MTQPISNYDVLTDLEAHLALAAWLQPRIEDWTGPSSSTGSGGRTSVADADPTLAAVEANLDNGGTPTSRLVDSANTYVAEVERIKQAIVDLNAKRHALQPMEQERARQRVNERTTPSTVGFCEADDTNCDAHDEYHSLVNGLCGACRKAFQRWPKTGDPGGDRKAFIEHRRREVGERRRRAS